MNPRFLRPNVLWTGIWVAIFMLIVSLGYWQTKLYWKNSFEKVQQIEFKVFHNILPYALAYLQEHGQSGLIQEFLDSNQELFTVVYTDPQGAIKYPVRTPISQVLSSGSLSDYKFSYVPPNPLRTESGADAGKETAAYGKLYLIAKSPPSLRESIWSKGYIRKVLPAESFLGFTLIGYFLVLVGFAAICSITAKFQNHFQSVLEEQHRSELETRDLRINVLESNLKTLDLNMQILDQEHEKALSASNTAQRAIDRLVRRLQSESTKNEELENKLDKAQLEYQNALQAIRAINEDRELLSAEKRELETLRQAQQLGHPVQYKPLARAKEFLWLHLVYKNLAFSKRALQNIIENQYVHDVFPSLPDALSVLNNSEPNSLVAGGALYPGAFPFPRVSLGVPFFQRRQNLLRPVPIPHLEHRHHSVEEALLP
jgi:ABC-type multidrug transport system fused ATPase/permease subunit